MRRFLPFLILLCGTLHAAAPTVAQHKANQAVNVSTITDTLTSNVTAGNDVWVWVGTDDTTRQTVSTPTMTGETFVKVTGCSSNTGGGAGNGQLQCYHLTGGNAVGGHNAITATISPGTTDLHIWAIEVHNQNQSAAPDASGNNEQAVSSGAVPAVSTSASTTNATDLVLSCQYDNNNSTGSNLTAGSGYVIVDQSNNGSGNDQGASEDLTTSSTGTQSAGMSGFSSGTDKVNQSIVAIAPAAGGGPTCKPELAALGVGCG